MFLTLSRINRINPLYTSPDSLSKSCTPYLTLNCSCFCKSWISVQFSRFQFLQLLSSLPHQPLINMIEHTLRRISSLFLNSMQGSIRSSKKKLLRIGGEANTSWIVKRNDNPNFAHLLYSSKPNFQTMSKQSTLIFARHGNKKP